MCSKRSRVCDQFCGQRQHLNGPDSANCLGVDPDLFFPERGASTREAKEVCRGCVVRMDCLEYALVNGEKFGIWGGLSERERRRLRRQRAQSNRRIATALFFALSHECVAVLTAKFDGLL